MDEPIPFYVLAVPSAMAEKVVGDETKQWTEEELEKLDIGYVKLVLLPRGKGELLVKAPQLYYSILDDETVTMSIDLLNEGNRRLDQIEITADVPLSWTREISPSSINMLDIGKEERVNLTFRPPEDIPVGKYEARIQTSGMSGGILIAGSDKIVTIEIRPRANILGTIAIVIFIIGIVGGIVFYGIRLSRR